MNILVVGSGGREHALAWKLKQSGDVAEIFCAPGNPGMRSCATLVPLKAADWEGLLNFARDQRIDLTVIGPEQPLADGVVDRFEAQGMPVFGPTRQAAELEWSKAFAKGFMQRHGIPTAAHWLFDASNLDAARKHVASCPLPVVLKADGLAAGKGVIVCATRDEALAAVHEIAEAKSFGAAGQRIVVEEWLDGEEASIFAITDGERYALLAPAQDHKRAFDGDRGKNTGGMGAYAPTPVVTGPTMQLIERSIIRPTIEGMAAEGRPYKGCLYVGIMLTKEGPKVVEYNSRFGDPETQAVLPLFEGDLAGLMAGASRGRLPAGTERPPKGTAVCVVLASGGYPDDYPSGLEIRGLGEAETLDNVAVFHAGTRLSGKSVVTAGGRVLGVTAFGTEGLKRTIESAYEAVKKISFPGMQYRSDIGRKALLS